MYLQTFQKDPMKNTERQTSNIWDIQVFRTWLAHSCWKHGELKESQVNCNVSSTLPLQTCFDLQVKYFKQQIKLYSFSGRGSSVKNFRGWGLGLFMLQTINHQLFKVCLITTTATEQGACTALQLLSSAVWLQTSCEKEWGAWDGRLQENMYLPSLLQLIKLSPFPSTAKKG